MDRTSQRQRTKAESSTVKYDPAKAKQLWTEGLKETGQTNPTLELLTDDTTNAKRSAEYIQSTLQQNLPGLKVTIATVPFKTPSFPFSKWSV